MSTVAYLASLPPLPRWNPNLPPPIKSPIHSTLYQKHFIYSAASFEFHDNVLKHLFEKCIYSMVKMPPYPSAAPLLCFCVSTK